MFYDSIFFIWSLKIWIWMSVFWLNYFFFWYSYIYYIPYILTIMIRLITKEKYVLRFKFLMWSLKVWILNVRFLIKLFFGYIRHFCYYAWNRPSPVETARGNFLNFSSGLEETLAMRLITKEKYVLRFDFFDMISQSLDLGLFTIYKLIKHPVPSKRHGEISWISPQG